MPGERVLRQINRMLDDVERAVEQHDWATVSTLCEAVLRLDPGNEDAAAFLAAAARDGSGGPATAGSQATEAERRRMTVMFCDLVGSSPLAEQLDPEDMRDMLRAYQRVCADAIEGMEGRIAHYIGDGILAYFGYPVAHEDDASRAVRAGLAIIDGLAGVAGRWAHDGVEPGARVGIHTGLVVVGEMGAGDRIEVADIVGDTANIAARIQSEAQMGEVVVSEATAELVEDSVTMEELGERSLRGFSKPVELFRAVGIETRWRGAERRSWSGPFVGGGQNLASLNQLAADAARGAGRVAVIHGEPGIGKSRLIGEFEAQLPAGSFTRIRFECSSYHQNSALWPVVSHLGAAVLGLNPADPDNSGRFSRGMAEAGVPDADAAFIANLLGAGTEERALPEGLSAEEVRRRTNAAIVDWFAREARKRPVLLIVEDLHWADPSTLEILEQVVARTPALAVLIIVATRSTAGLAWMRRGPVTSVALERLSTDEARELVVSIVGGEEAGRVVDQVVARSDGVPLFAEELAKAAMEPAVDDNKAEGRPIPGTLSESLTARLDRLGTAKQVALAASVAGRQFSVALLSELMGKDRDELAAPVQSLVEAGIVEPVRGEYAFRHALLRETAYQSMVRPRRQELHRKIAEHMASSPEGPAEPEVVAFHYASAKLPGEAVGWWMKAGQTARAQWANQEAIAHFQQALEALQASDIDAANRDDTERTIRLAMGPPLTAMRGYTSSEVEANYQRAAMLCEQIGDPDAQARALNGLRGFYQVRGDLARARQIAVDVAALAQGSSSALIRGLAALGLGEVEMIGGHSRVAIVRLEEALACLDPLATEGDIEPREAAIAARCHLALALWNAGEPESATDRVREAVGLADEWHRPFRKAYALVVGGWVYDLCHDWDESERLGLEGQRLAEELGFPYWHNSALVGLGYVSTSRGKTGEAIERFRTASAAGEASGATTTYSRLYAGLAAALCESRDVAGAREQIEIALSNVERTEERFCEPDIYRVRARISAAEGERAQARRDYEQGLTIAREAGMASYELRIACEMVDVYGKEPGLMDVLNDALERFPGQGQGVDFAKATEILKGHIEGGGQ